MEKIFNEKGTLLNGSTFEAFIAEQLKGEHDGAPGKPDVVLKDGRKVECKFFTRAFNHKTGKALYNYANGFTVRRRDALLQDLRDYCEGFDLLAIGTGNFGERDTCDWELMSAAEAFDWLADRIMAKGTEAIRFAFEAEPHGGGSAESRLARLHKNGFAL